MTTTWGPALYRRKLTTELHKLHTTSGLTTAQVGTQLHQDRTKISHILAGRRLPPYPTLVLLLSVYQHPERLSEFTELLAGAEQKGWWETIPDVEMRDYIGLESDATQVTHWALEQVPSILATDAYATKLGTDVATTRLRRSRVGSDIAVDLICSESVLTRLACMGEVGHDQAQAMVDSVRSFRVVPFSVGLPVSAGSFSVFEFPDSSVTGVGFLGGPLGVELVDDSVALHVLAEETRQMRSVALSEKSSRELVGRSQPASR